MNSNVLGRTNVEYPKVWASLGVSGENTPEELVSAVRELRIPIDISSQPALWGGFLRGGEDVLVQRGTTHYERANSQDHATDLMQAHMIEVLSSIGREMIDFYFLRVRRAVEEFQINGVMAALEFAKQEGHIRHIGLLADGPSLAVQSVWQFHDAFEVVLLPSQPEQELKALIGLAQQRRVGIVQVTPDTQPQMAHTALVPVQTLAQVATLRSLGGVAL
jgi:hypothetical protein